MFCWGLNSSGQLGNGSTTSTGTPTLVANLNDAVAVSAGVYHTCAVHLYSGALQCWGTPGDQPPAELRH